MLAAYNIGNVPETTTATEILFTDPHETEMGNSEQLEGENVIYGQKRLSESNFLAHLKM